MKTSRLIASAFIATLSLAILLVFCGTAAAQSAKAQGLITGRSGDTMTVQTPDSSTVVVLLTDSTQVAQVQASGGSGAGVSSGAGWRPGMPAHGGDGAGRGHEGERQLVGCVAA